MNKLLYFILGIGTVMLLAADYKIQSDKLIVGRKTDGEKALEFQSSAATSPKISINADDPDSLLFSEQNFILGENAGAFPDDGYSLLFQQQAQPQHALPGINFDGTKIQVRNKTGDVWENLATGWGLTTDQNKFLDDTLIVNSRTDVPISDFGTAGHFLVKIGARTPNLADYQTETQVNQAINSFPTLYTVLIKTNFTILRFENANDPSERYTVTEITVPGNELHIAGYKQYQVTIPPQTSAETFNVIVSEGQAEEYSFSNKLVINRNNLSTDVQNSLGSFDVVPPPTDNAAHDRFKRDLTYSTIDQESWTPVNNHPNYRPYHFKRLAAGFWGEDQTGTISNYFEDISGVNFSLAQTGGGTSAHFGESSGWGNRPSYFSNTLTITNDASGNHGGAEIGTGDFVSWYSTNTVLPSTGLTRLANAGPSNVKTNFNSLKRIEIETSGQNRLGFLAIRGTNQLLFYTDTNLGNLSLYKNGTLVTANVSPQAFGGALNDDASGNLFYQWTTTIDANDTLAFASSDATFRMRLVNAENTIRLGDFTRLSGGPFINDYRRAVGFDFRLGDTVTGNNPLLVIGNDSAVVNFGGLSILRQTLVGYDELGPYLLVGDEDGGVASSPPTELNFLSKETQTIPTRICTIEASGSESTSPITNNCQFNLNLPTSGATNLKVFAHFLNTTHAAGEQAMPVSIVNQAVTVGTNLPQTGTNLTMASAKNAAGGYDTQSVLISVTYNGTSNQVSLGTSSAIENFLRANDSTISLNLSVASENTQAHQANTTLSKQRIWVDTSPNQTQSIVFWLYPEANQSPDETDPYLAITGQINGASFGVNLNRRASEFDFSNMKFNNANANMAHLQIYSYDFLQNQVTNIYGPNNGGQFVIDMYTNLNQWLGLYYHPTDDVGEFIVNDSLRVQGDVIGENLVETTDPNRVSVQNCRISSAGAVASDSCASWIFNSRRPVVGRYQINIRTGFFSDTPTCFISPISDGSISNCSASSTPVNGTQLLVGCSVNNTRILQSRPFNVICMGPKL